MLCSTDRFHMNPLQNPQLPGHEVEALCFGSREIQDFWRVFDWLHPVHTIRFRCELGPCQN